LQCRLGGGSGGRSRRAVSQQVFVGGDRGSELPDQPTELVDLADYRLDAVGIGRIGRGDAALDRREPAAELGHLAGEVGGAARQVGGAGGAVAAVGQAARRRVVQG